MANSFINKKADLTTTDLTSLYTVPDFKTSVVKSILVSNDSGSSCNIDVTLVNASSAIFSLFKTKAVDTRARARAIALKVENTGSSQDWKLGTFRLDIQPDGRR